MMIKEEPTLAPLVEIGGQEEKFPCCPTMDRMLLPEANARKAGLSTLVITNFETGRTAFCGVVSKRSSKDSGVLLNLCPWCGTNLLRHLGEGKRSIRLGEAE